MTQQNCSKSLLCSYPIQNCIQPKQIFLLHLSSIERLPRLQHPVRYLPRCARALRSVALEICIRPSNGVYISRIKKIAPDTDSAQTNNVAIAVAWRGAKRPKLLKIMASQKTSVASKGMEMKLPPCSNISQRIFPRSIAIFNAWAWSER